MKSMKRGLAVLLAILLIIPTLPVSAEELTPSAGAATAAQTITAPEAQPEKEEAPEPEKTPEAEEVPEPEKTPEAEEVPEPETTPAPEEIPSEEATPAPEETPSEETTPAPEETSSGETTPEPEKVPEGEVTPEPETTPAPGETASPVNTASPLATATPEKTNAPDTSAAPAVSAVPSISPAVSASVSPSVSPTASVSPSPSLSPSPSVSPTPTVSPTPEASVSPEELITDKVLFNTGSYAFSIVNQEAFEAGAGDGCFEEDGSYTINIPEENPFFPYEVQFTYEDEVFNEWFMNPGDSVEVGGHNFYVSAYFDNTVVTQMSLRVGGDTVIVYPEEKTFSNDSDEMVMSLLPLEERKFSVDLTVYTPVELTMVSLTDVFTGENALTDTDKVVWNYLSTNYGDDKNGNTNDDYHISMSGDRIDLSHDTCSGGETWEMIVGAANQLAADNTRYIIYVDTANCRNWLVSSVYLQDKDGNRKDKSGGCRYEDGSSQRYLDVDFNHSDNLAYVNRYLGLKINSNIFPQPRYASLKIYEGLYNTAAEAMAGTDITSQILNVDMTQTNAGYVGYDDFTMVSFDGSGNVTGCLPVLLYSGWTSNSPYVYSDNLFKKTDDGREYVKYTSDTSREDGCENEIITLYNGYSADGFYYLDMNCYNGTVTAAYVGQYASIEEAKATGATDIKDVLFSNDYNAAGYAADYSKGVYFTIFMEGNGGNKQYIEKRCITTVEGTVSKLDSGTGVTFKGLNDSDGKEIDSYVVSHDDDSYGEKNFITILVGENQDITNLAPVFTLEKGIRLYTSESSTPEVSGESFHDFSKGALQYSAAAEDGTNLKNYWLQVVKAKSGRQLYINSLADSSANTREENGVIYSTREVMLDGYHNFKHDIFISNMGTEDIPALKAELASDTVVLDDYWTLNGDYTLPGFKTISTTAQYGDLPNLAKIRINAKEGVSEGSDVSGTLTIKSGDTVLAVLTLTGTIGNPCITTDEIPQAVKYVPYGSVIQNNNKYSWNKVTYSLSEGKLPDGMEVKPNGEIYGVPKETGDFTFTVKMENSSKSFSSSEKTYTLTVIENTDANVDAATDTGYDLSQRVQNVKTDTLSGSQTLVSQGIFAEFVDIYLDGEKLAEGTDYTAESGSTRITIMNQTLAQGGNGGTGTHTLGVEFRTQDTDELMRAAQNYVVEGENDDGEPDEDNDNGGDSDNDSESTPADNNANTINTANSAGATGKTAGAAGSASTPAAGADAAEAVSYTVVSGDTLWKIAEKFYGSGEYWQKIYNDNADIISNPDRIYEGQVLKLYPLQGDAVTAAISGEGNAVAEDGIQGNYYTVQPGDTLWKIALKVYGKGWRWRKIYQANKSTISDPGQLYVGQVLVIPD